MTHKAAPHHHNHTACIASALQAADELCQSRATRLTALRREVLKVLWSSHQARGAYDLLAELNAAQTKAKGKGKMAPLSVYRALDFLVAEGLAHRIECLNAYVGCPHPHEQHALQFLICTTCRNVTELDDAAVRKHLSAASKAHGFTPTRSIIEIMGCCAACAEAA